MKDVGEKTLIAAMSELTEVMNKNVKAVDRLEKLMVDTACVMAKLADSVTRLKWTIEEREKQEEKRKGRRKIESEKRRGDVMKGGGEMTGGVGENQDIGMMTRRTAGN